MKLFDAYDPEKRLVDSWNIYADCLGRDSTADWAREQAAEMMNLLVRLETELEEGGEWFGHTSHHTLCLNPEPASTASHLVAISPLGGSGVLEAGGKSDGDVGRFKVLYRTSNPESPCSSEEVEMVTRSVTECLAALEVAFRNCR